MHNDVQAIKKKLIDHYDEDAPAYHRANYGAANDYLPLEWRQHYIEEMIDSLGLPESARVLDVGCGPGELVLSLRRRGFALWGVDISEGMIAEARELLQKNGQKATATELAVGDIEALDFEDAFFDVVVASGVLEYQKTDDKALAEMGRVLRPGGCLILNVTNRYGYLNWIDEPYRWLKKRRTGRAVLEFLKKRVLGRDEIHDLPDRRTHVPFTFDGVLLRHGFAKSAENYFHFSPLPMPLDSVFPGVAKGLGKRMETWTRSPIGRLLGGGYLVMARKRR